MYTDLDTMTFIERIVKQKPFLITKITVLVLVAIALMAEILPEMEAKLIVIPTLILVLIVGLLDLKNKDRLHNINHTT
jgi:hypothetical protein